MSTVLVNMTEDFSDVTNISPNIQNCKNNTNKPGDIQNRGKQTQTWELSDEKRGEQCCFPYSNLLSLWFWTKGVRSRTPP